MLTDHDLQRYAMSMTEPTMNTSIRVLRIRSTFTWEKAIHNYILQLAPLMHFIQRFSALVELDFRGAVMDDSQVSYPLKPLPTCQPSLRHLTIVADACWDMASLFHQLVEAGSLTSHLNTLHYADALSVACSEESQSEMGRLQDAFLALLASCGAHLQTFAFDDTGFSITSGPPWPYAAGKSVSNNESQCEAGNLIEQSLSSLVTQL